MSKLGEDNYKRPKKTFTDKLTDDDIKAAPTGIGAVPRVDANFS